jgi:effector-binding domain-containing protein
MFNKVFYTIVIIVLVIFFVGLFLPRAAHVERTVEIQRPAATVFTLVNGFEAFPEWSPWLERDPGIELFFSGPRSGAGARMSWSGDPRLVGSGTQEIIESTPWSMVRMRMDIRQMGEALGYFQIDPTANGVSLTRGFDADLVEGYGFFQSLMNRYFGLFFDRWIGNDYEQGLARIKELAESMPEADFSDLEVERVQAKARDILYVEAGGSRSGQNLSERLTAAYREISSLMADQALEMDSQPMAITRRTADNEYEYRAAIPVTSSEVELSGNVRVGTSPSGTALRVNHRGPYDELPAVYAKLSAYMAVHGIRQGLLSWEHYISDPGRTNPEETVTHVYFLIDEAETGGGA